MADEVVTTPFGKFLITRGDLIGETTRAGTLWDGPGFLQVIAKEHGRLGEPGVTILDIGANQGAFSIWLAQHGAWRVVAVEPVPHVMQRLKANLDLNRKVTAGVVIPIEVAGYHREARLALGAFDPGNWGGTAVYPDGQTSVDVEGREWHAVADKTVEAVPLDYYQFLWSGTLSRVTLIKIDAQGCDGCVLLGLGATIRAHHPAIVFEWDADLAKPHGFTLKDAQLWLESNGYETHEWPSQPNNYLALPKPRTVTPDTWSGVD